MQVLVGALSLSDSFQDISLMRTLSNTEAKETGDIHDSRGSSCSDVRSIFGTGQDKFMRIKERQLSPALLCVSQGKTFLGISFLGLAFSSLLSHPISCTLRGFFLVAWCCRSWFVAHPWWTFFSILFLLLLLIFVPCFLVLGFFFSSLLPPLFRFLPIHFLALPFSSSLFLSFGSLSCGPAPFLNILVLYTYSKE